MNDIVLLVVDDEPLILDLLDASLADAGYSIVTAASARDAIDRLGGSDNMISGIITDVRLGGDEDGWDVARHARGLDPNFPVLYMTGDSSHDWNALGVPNSVLIQKPFAVAQVITAISNLLNEAAEKSTAT